MNKTYIEEMRDTFECLHYSCLGLILVLLVLKVMLLGLILKSQEKQISFLNNGR